MEGGHKKLPVLWFEPLFHPIRSWDHLGLGNGSKKVEQCKPYPQYIDRHTQVVKEVKERDEHDNIQAREVATRSLESGQPDDDIDVEKFGNSTSFVKP